MIQEVNSDRQAVMMILDALLILMFSAMGSFAQTINWEKLDMDEAFGYTSTVDGANNVITVAAGPSEFQSTSLHVRKYDEAGNLLFETSIDAEDLNAGQTDNALPYQVETDGDNNIIIGGVNTIINTSTSSSCFTPPCYFPTAAKIWKLDADGNVIFNKTLLGHSNGFQQLMVDDDFIEVDADGNIYYAGRGEITDTGGETAFGTILVKLAPDGTTVFTDVEDIVGSGNTIGRGFMALGSDFVAIANSTTSDEELTAWDGSGNVLWNITLSSSIDAFRSIAVDESTNDTYILAETFPPDPIVIKVNSDGDVEFTEIYDLGEGTVVNGLGFTGGDTLAFGATTWSDLGNSSTFYATLVSKSDGSILVENTYTLSENLSRIRDFETNSDKGEYFAAVNSTNNGGVPSEGTVHAYYADGSEWHAVNPNSRVRSLAFGLTDEVYITTDNIWDLYQYINSNPCSGFLAEITNFEDELCPGDCNGEATVEAIGGQSPYNYEWSDPGSQMTPTATGLCDGSYTVTITDDNDCTATATVAIGTTGDISAPTTVDQNESCEAACDGVVTVNPTGGSSPYTFLWNDPAGQMTQTASNLCPGIYIVTVTDANGCTGIGTAQIQEGPQPTTPTFTFDTELCLDDDPIDLPPNSNNGISGSWSGTGVTPNTFDPATAGIGSHDITFTPDIGQCAATVSITMIVEDCVCQNPPTANAGADQTLCAGANLIIQLNGEITNVGSATWTTSGSGSFDDSTALDADYTPSQDDKDNGSVTLTLTTADPDGTGPCLPASDEVVMVLNFQPAIDDYADTSACFEHELPPYQGTLSPNVGYFDGAGGTGNSYEPGDLIIENTTMYVYDETDEGCVDEDTFEITINEVVASASVINNESCAGDCDGQATASGGTDYLWSDGQTTATAFGLCAGSYEVTVSDTNGCSDVESISIMPGAEVIASVAVENNESCAGDCDGQATASGGADYLWSDGQTTATATGLCAGTFEVTVSDASGCSDVVSVVIDGGSSILTPSFSFTTQFCEDDSLFSLPTISDNGITGDWSGPGVTNNIFNPETAGVGSWEVTFTPETAQCASVAFVTMVVEDCACQNPAVVDAGDDQSHCADTTLTIQLDGMIEQVSGASWTTDGSGTFNDNEALDALYIPSEEDLDSGFVILTLTTEDPDGSGPCSPASDQLVLEFTFQPSIGNYDDVQACFEYILPAIPGEVTDSASYYTETSGMGDQFIAGDTITESVTLFVYDSTQGGCSDEEMFEITINALSADAGQDTTVQFGTAAILKGSAIGGSGNYEYNWSPDSLILNAQNRETETTALEATQTFMLEVSDVENACVAADEVIVQVEGGALSVNISATSDQICLGEPTLLSATASGGSGQYSYTWTDPDDSLGTGTEIEVIPEENTVYTVLVDDGFTQVTDTFLISVNPLPTVDAGENQFFCFGEENTQHCGNEVAGVFYLWTHSDGETFDSRCAQLKEGSWVLELTDSLGCSDRDTVFVEELDELVVELFADTTVDISGGLPPYDTTFTSTNDTLAVSVIDANGCEAEGTIVSTSIFPVATFNSVEIYPNPVRDRIRIGEMSIKIDRAELLDMHGRTYLKQVSSRREIAIDNLPAGLYILRIWGSEGSVWQGKVIIQK